MRTLVERGVSPISGRPMPGYRGKYLDKIRKTGKAYGSDGDKHPKKDRPINLAVSGDFINSIKVFSPEKTGSGYVPTIGFKDGSKFAKMEEGHREGVNGQAKRPIIPTEKEGFAPSINAKIIEFIKNKIEDINLE